MILPRANNEKKMEANGRRMKPSSLNRDFNHNNNNHDRLITKIHSKEINKGISIRNNLSKTNNLFLINKRVVNSSNQFLQDSSSDKNSNSSSPNHNLNHNHNHNNNNNKFNSNNSSNLRRKANLKFQRDLGFSIRIANEMVFYANKNKI